MGGGDKIKVVKTVYTGENGEAKQVGFDFATTEQVNEKANTSLDNITAQGKKMIVDAVCISSEYTEIPKPYEWKQVGEHEPDGRYVEFVVPYDAYILYRTRLSAAPSMIGLTDITIDLNAAFPAFSGVNALSVTGMYSSKGHILQAYSANIDNMVDEETCIRIYKLKGVE